MKRTPQLATTLFILLFSACTNHTLNVGENLGAGGSPPVTPATGGATPPPVASGGAGVSGVGGGAGASGVGGSGALACSGTSLKASEAHNYSFSSRLTFPPITVAANTELTLDWEGVTQDFMNHPLDPRNDLKKIRVFLWKLPLASLEEKTNADTLLMKDLVTLPLEYSTDGSGTSAKLFQFSNSGEPSEEMILSFFDPDLYPSDRYSYTVMASGSLLLGEGTKMIQSFRVEKGNPETTVRLTASSTGLEWEAHLQNAQVTGIPAGQAAITLDWTDMKTNALGNPFEPPSYIAEVLIGHYDESVAELETKFLDIELIAKELYRATIDAGTSIDLRTLTLDGDSSTHFPGIDDTGTWLVALQCGACRNPAPWYLTVLKPCG
jgi:hypothetical protein